MITVTKSNVLSDGCCSACDRAKMETLSIYKIELSTLPSQSVVIRLCPKCLKEFQKKVKGAK